MTNELFLKKDEFEQIFRYHLKIETYSKSIDNLFGPKLLNKIDYKPYYQRNYVWDVNKATYFIESIMLGTEIPPLIFFNNGKNIEIIDGRQRFETIKRFFENDFSLTKKGLSILPNLVKLNFDSIRKDHSYLLELFLDAKIRIIEFAIVNEPPMDDKLKDKIKKEIFGRYNSGITPLKKSEIDNAIYDDDPISTNFKHIFKKEKELAQEIYQIFLPQRNNPKKIIPIDGILQFIRRYLVLYKFPIKYYAWGTARTETLTKLYQLLMDSAEDEQALCSSFLKKVEIISKIKNQFITNHFGYNRLVFECLLWVFYVIENEGINLKELESPELQRKIVFIISSNLDKYSEEDHHFQKAVIERYNYTASIFAELFNLDLRIYLGGDDKTSETLKEIRKSETKVDKLNKLETLRITKPAPEYVSIDDIVRTMTRKRFLVRPSYQRSEVINLSKASAIIESILLDVILPAIFVFKRNDNVSEVIDGQQRILSILGFICQSYLDEDNNSRYTLNNNYSLRGLRILKDLNGSKFKDLPQTLQDKILEFNLFVVEIEERLNPEFNPVDLFIRLNDKPFPIREHSFEMWNSWVDKDILDKIKNNVTKRSDWIYLKQLKKSSDRDRMENEELYITLVYLDYKYNQKSEFHTSLDIYAKTDRINSRIRDKNDISTVLAIVSQDELEKEKFLQSIKNVERFISKLKLILLDRDKDKTELSEFLKIELDDLFKAKKESRYFKRTMQDFYIFWIILIDINYEMVKYHRIEMKEKLRNIFIYMKNIPESDASNGYANFISLINEFKEYYKKDDRKIKLTEEQLKYKIVGQDHKCAISGAPVFLGDDIDVDHNDPLAIGGKDEQENLQIAHRDSNQEKGARKL